MKYYNRYEVSNVYATMYHIWKSSIVVFYEISIKSLINFISRANNMLIAYYCENLQLWLMTVKLSTVDKQ